MKNSQIKNLDLTSSGWSDYELLDSGNKEKFERFGDFRLIRFEPEAIWKPALTTGDWASADARFRLEKGQNQGAWTSTPQMPDTWVINLDTLKFSIFIKSSRHIGIFPEQYPNWEWIEQTIKKSQRKIKVLNLFAYTGAATLFAARAGAEVTHVEAVKSSISTAKKNLEDSGLRNKPVRWMQDDAFKFVQREIRRGSQYDAIIMDPPKFGRGPGGEIWKFDNDISALIASCFSILSKQPLFFIITAYNVDTAPISLARSIQNQIHNFIGEIIYGKIIQQEKSAGRKISQSIYARWENKNSEV